MNPVARIRHVLARRPWLYWSAVLAPRRRRRRSAPPRAVAGVDDARRGVGPSRARASWPPRPRARRPARRRAPTCAPGRVPMVPRRPLDEAAGRGASPASTSPPARSLVAVDVAPERVTAGPDPRRVVGRRRRRGRAVGRRRRRSRHGRRRRRRAGRRRRRRRAHRRGACSSPCPIDEAPGRRQAAAAGELALAAAPCVSVSASRWRGSTSTATPSDDAVDHERHEAARPDEAQRAPHRQPPGEAGGHDADEHRHDEARRGCRRRPGRPS